MNNLRCWFEEFYAAIATTPLSHWLETAPAQLSNMRNATPSHGDAERWVKGVVALPKTKVTRMDLKDSVTFGLAEDVEDGTKKFIVNILNSMMPWRKGPYHIHGIHVDTEWRSDFKWDRIAPHICNLKDKYVLDIGCGSGYHMFRMLGAGSRLVVGVDPSELFLCQFQVMKHFMKQYEATTGDECETRGPLSSTIHLLPLGVEHLPDLRAFDVVFAMGVLYHRKSPIEFLQQLKNQLKKGGQVVLETLVVEGDERTVLVPEDRYAKMRNVWFLPSCPALLRWMNRAGFKNARVVDKTVTTLQEQRKTEWMTTESLDSFLDPNDRSKTIEGHEAPCRATIVAEC